MPKRFRVLYTEPGSPRLLPWPDGIKRPAVWEIEALVGDCKKPHFQIKGVFVSSLYWIIGTRWEAKSGFTHRKDPGIKKLVRAELGLEMRSPEPRS